MQKSTVVKRTLLSFVLLFAASLSTAQVLVVNVFESMPGKVPTSLEYAMEAGALFQKMGVSPTIGLDQLDRLHYAVRFDNWTEYAKFQTKLQSSAEWSAFLGKVNANPSATLAENYRMNIVAPAALGNVIEVFIWQATPGHFNDLLQAGMEAKAIHEKPGGVSVSINADEMNRLHYVMSYESLEAWAKYQDTPNPEFQEFFTKFDQDQIGTLWRHYSVRRMN